jgi:hypothetical protein
LPLATPSCSRAPGSPAEPGGNPLAAAASNAALAIIEDERLVENSAKVGAAMLAELETFVDRYPFVGFVSRAGLFLRIFCARTALGDELHDQDHECSGPRGEGAHGCTDWTWLAGRRSRNALARLPHDAPGASVPQQEEPPVRDGQPCAPARAEVDPASAR